MDVDIWQKTQIGISKENSHQRSRVLNGRMWISPPCSVGPPLNLPKVQKASFLSYLMHIFHTFSPIFKCLGSGGPKIQIHIWPQYHSSGSIWATFQFF